MLKVLPNTPLYCGLRSPNKDFVLKAVGDPVKIDISNALDRTAAGKQLIFKGLIRRDLFLVIPKCFGMMVEMQKNYGKDMPPVWAPEMLNNEDPYFNWGPRVPPEDVGCTILSISLLYDYYQRVCQMPDPEPVLVHSIMIVGPWFEHDVIRKLDDRKWELTHEQIHLSLKTGLKQHVKDLDNLL